VPLWAIKKPHESYYCPAHKSKPDRPMHLIPPLPLEGSTQALQPSPDGYRGRHERSPVTTPDRLRGDEPPSLHNLRPGRPDTATRGSPASATFQDTRGSPSKAETAHLLKDLPRRRRPNNRHRALSIAAPHPSWHPRAECVQGEARSGSWVHPAAVGSCTGMRQAAVSGRPMQTRVVSEPGLFTQGEASPSTLPKGEGRLEHQRTKIPTARVGGPNRGTFSNIPREQGVAQASKRQGKRKTLWEKSAKPSKEKNI